MKPLDRLSSVEKGKLLFELFPQEIPVFLAFQKAVTDNLLRDPDQLKEHWEAKFFDPELWLRFAGDIHKALEKYKGQLARRSRLFADQLFDGYTVIYTSYCLRQFAEHELSKDPHFKIAVALFFS